MTDGPIDDDPAADFADVGTPSLGRIAMTYERPVAGAVAVKTEPMSLLGAVASVDRKTLRLMALLALWSRSDKARSKA